MLHVLMIHSSLLLGSSLFTAVYFATPWRTFGLCVAIGSYKYSCCEHSGVSLRVGIVVLWGRDLGVERLGHLVGVCLNFQETA